MYDLLAKDDLSGRSAGQQVDVHTRMRILLVEDDAGHIRLVKRAFGVARDSYEVTVVKSLQDARVALKRQSFDLVICELLLPDGRGTDLLAHPANVTAGDGQSMPFVLLTAPSNEQTAVKAIRAGALDYVVKSKTALLGLPRFAERALRQWQQIVARVKAERLLRESEACLMDTQSQLLFHKTLLECQSQARLDGILVLGADRECIFASKHFLEMWAIPDSELQILSGEQLLRAIAQRVVDNVQFLTVIEDLDADPQQMIRDEVDLADNRCFERFSGPVASESGHYFGRVWWFRDITKRKQAEQRTQDLLSQLSHVNRLSSWGEMASALAHEMNQPLGTVANYAGTCVDLIAENRLDMGDLKRSLEKINEQCLRAGNIIGRLKRFASKAVPSRTTIDINELACEVKRLMISNPHHCSDIQLDLDRCVPPTLGDPIQIQQVLVHLIQNAIDAASADPRGARIVISTTANNTDVTIRVADRSTGIPESQLEQIFESSVSDKTDSWGMGLRISRTIIGDHGGHLWATNNENGGATLHISLPIRSESADSTHQLHKSSRLPVPRELS